MSLKQLFIAKLSILKLITFTLFCLVIVCGGLKAQSVSHEMASGYKSDTVHSNLYCFRHHIIYLNIADYILQKYNIGYEYLPQNEKWRIRGYTFVDVKDQNYGLSVNAYSNWKISKHVTHIVGGSLQAEYIGSFYEDFYLKFRPRGYAIDPAFATGLIFTAADRFVFGLEAAIGPGMVFRDERFKGVFLDVRLGVSLGVKF